MRNTLKAGDARTDHSRDRTTRPAISDMLSLTVHM